MENGLQRAATIIIGASGFRESNLLPFATLQDLQAITQLSHVLLPPILRVTHDQ